MKRFVAIAILGLTSVGVAAQQAAAGLLDIFHHCHCCMKVCAKQYNAFSPYCIDSVKGCCPGPGLGGYVNGNGGDEAACYPNGGAPVEELPAPGNVANPTATAPPSNGQSISGTPYLIPGGSRMPPGAAYQMMPPGAAYQAMPPGAAYQAIPPGAAYQAMPPGAAYQVMPPGAAYQPSFVPNLTNVAPVPNRMYTNQPR